MQRGKKKTYWAVCFGGDLKCIEYKDGRPLIYDTKKKAEFDWDLIANEQSVIPVHITQVPQ